eukprot:COSAG02_NODE_5692_length_4119_cov_2.601244_4_plen_170_part_00
MVHVTVLLAGQVSLPKRWAVVGVKTLIAHNQSVTVGYNITSQNIRGFADVSASLSPLGARTDVAPVSQNRTALELRVFVDGHMVTSLDSNYAWTIIIALRSSVCDDSEPYIFPEQVETFFSGDAVITTVTGNVVPSARITSGFVNTAAFDCSVQSWTLGLNDSVLDARH